MDSSRHIFLVDAHVGGEPVRIVVGGIPRITGKSMAEKKHYVAENLDEVRTGLMLEPRGHRDMFGAILTESPDPEADFGLIFMDTGGYINMCGHATIGAVTVALQLGFVPSQGELTQVTIDTPAGLVHARAHMCDGVVTDVTIRNVASFLYAGDFHLDVPSIGTISMDIAFGGNFTAIVPAAQLGVSAAPEYSSKIVEIGMPLMKLINESMDVCHPTAKHIRSVDLLELVDSPTRPEASARNVVLLGAGSLDRSPCGTGTCAKMAALHAKGQLLVGEEFVHESMIGSLFRGRLVEETTVGPYRAVVPEITATAHITGLGQAIMDPADPFASGFLVGGASWLESGVF